MKQFQIKFSDLHNFQLVSTSNYFPSKLGRPHTAINIHKVYFLFKVLNNNQYASVREIILDTLHFVFKYNRIYTFDYYSLKLNCHNIEV